MELKQQLYQYCEDFIEKRLEAINKTIRALQQALHSETKSSAGDKHETGRAMVQLEREKAGQQLAQVMKIKEVLAKIDVANTSQVISVGSVVYTTQTNYYIAISAGEIVIEDDQFFAISVGTPIGKELLSKSVGDTFCFNGRTIEILKID